MFVWVCLSACPFISLSNCPFIHQSVCTLYFVPSKQKKSFLHLVYLRVCHCLLLTISLSVCFSSVYLFVNSSVYLPICLFVHLSVRTLPWKTVDRRNPRWILWQSSRWTIVGLEPPSPRSQSWNPTKSWKQTLQVTSYKLQVTSHRNRSLKTQYSPEYKHYKLQITSYKSPK